VGTLRPADLDLCAIDPQRHAFGRGVGEHIGQRGKPQQGFPGTANPR
jgi:hypothetical protein